MENEYQYWKQKGLEVFRKQLQQEVVNETQKIAHIMIEHQIKQLENDEWGDWMDLKQLCQL
jgi:hypothetical protein